MAYVNEKKLKLINIFKDTLDYIREEDDLVDSLEYSKRESEFVKADEYFDLEEPCREGKIVVTKSRTFEAAMRYAQDENYSDKLIAVLNFASASNPGGGVEKGSSAQEESLCRCSTLYPVLTQHRFATDFYNPNRKSRNPLHTDDLIYSPGIVIIKSDTDYPERLMMDDWCQVDVITCAAPNLSPHPSNRYNQDGTPLAISNDELYDLHYSRAEHILNTAAAHGVEVLILGAFGCGAFYNNPDVVANAYYDVLKEYAQYFEVVEFAVYTSIYDNKNYKAFYDTFSV